MSLVISTRDMVINGVSSKLRVDPTGLLRFCDTLRRTENADLAEAIMGFFKKGERAGYFRIAAIRDSRPPTE